MIGVGVCAGPLRRAWRRLLSELNEVECAHADENYWAILARNASVTASGRSIVDR